MNGYANGKVHDSGHVVQRPSKGSANDSVVQNEQSNNSVQREHGSKKYLQRAWSVCVQFYQALVTLFNRIASYFKGFERDDNMKIDSQGVRTDNNIWVRAEGVGFQHGFTMEKEFKQKGIKVVPDIFNHCLEKFGKTLCLGTRKLIQRNRVEEKAKTFEKLTLGEYEWKSYKEISDELSRVAVGLNSLGLSRGSRVAILAETRADLLTSIIGCLRGGLTVVTLYTNLTDSGLTCGITETEVDTVITSFELLPRLLSILDDCPSIKTIVVLEDQLAGVGNVSKVPETIRVIPFSDLLASADLSKLHLIEKPEEQDTAIIMYTSGSTGAPKGVEITHKNILTSVIAYGVAANAGKGDRYLAFLPLAHIMELVTEISLLALGVTIAYSSPNTLTSTGTKIAKGTLGDARVASPTILTAVPLILDRIIKGITQKVEKEGKMKGKIFQKAIEAKQNNGKSFTSKVFDVIIFKKVKAELGGRLKMMVVGGAPLSPQTHSKIMAMFGCTIQVGYGCTESAAGATAMMARDKRTGHTGPPNYGGYIKLEDWEEGGYLTTDKPHPRGEIVIGGSQVSKGYYKNEAETNASYYDENGIRWFRTGDIGMFDDSGVLYVVDRRKDLVKLNNGEYVSLGGVESKLKTSCLVENICVFAEPGENYPVAVVVPNKDAFFKFIKKTNLPQDETFDLLCKDERAAKLLLKEIQTHGKKSGLNRWDIPQALSLSPYPWTPETGLVTAALKLRRRVLQKEFRQEVIDMYKGMR